MKSTNTLSHVNKLSFALDYVKAEKKYLKYKKLQNITTGVGCGIVALVSLIAAFGSIATALSVAIFGAMITLPTFFVFNSTKRYIIDNASNEQVSFRQFRKMEKSGELKQLIAEINRLNK